MERSRSDNKVLTSTSEYTNSKVPASILDKSKISFINWSSNALLFSMISAYSCFSSNTSVSARILEKPTIAFSGVRISWLILAKKADLRRLDSSALFFASSNSRSTSFRSEIIKEEPTNVRGFPFSSFFSTAAQASTHSSPCNPLFGL